MIFFNEMFWFVSAMCFLHLLHFLGFCLFQRIDSGNVEFVVVVEMIEIVVSDLGFVVDWFFYWFFHVYQYFGLCLQTIWLPFKLTTWVLATQKHTFNVMNLIDLLQNLTNVINLLTDILPLCLMKINLFF